MFIHRSTAHPVLPCLCRPMCGWLVPVRWGTLQVFLSSFRHHSLRSWLCRDHPKVIRKRIISVFLSVTLAFSHVLTFIHRPNSSVVGCSVVTDPLALSLSCSKFDISSYDFHKCFIRFDNAIESIAVGAILTLVSHFFLARSKRPPCSCSI